MMFLARIAHIYSATVAPSSARTVLRFLALLDGLQEYASVVLGARGLSGRRFRLFAKSRCEQRGLPLRILGVALFALLSPVGIFSQSTQEEGPEREALLLSSVRQFSFQGRRAGEGYFSQDGSKLIFQSERHPGNPFFQIYLMDLNTGETEQVSPGLGRTTCAWIHPSGRKVLFSSTHEDPEAELKQQQELERRESGRQQRYSWDYDEHYEIFERGLGTPELKNLTQSLGYDAEASWSPDGSQIVFASNRQAYSQPLSSAEQEIFERDKSYFVDLYIMDQDGGGLRQLTDSKGYDGGPFFSPDGKEVVWRRFSEDGARAEILTMSLEDGPEKQITDLGAMSWAPYYHPSGDYLIFSTNLHGFDNFELYLVDRQGSRDPVRVTTTSGFDGLPVFSPDGGELVWTSTRSPGGQSQLFRASWDHQQARTLLGLSAELSGVEALFPESGEAPELTATQPEISTRDLRQHVGYLASAGLEGRQTGMKGEREATAYVASAFQFLGLEPAGDSGSFFQEFEFEAAASLGGNNRLGVLSSAESKEQFRLDEEWRPLTFSGTGSFPASQVVFAGYGIVAPEREGFDSYDSYVHLAVEGKWVMIFRYLPENISPERRQHLSRYSTLRYKTTVARDRGAKGLIIVSGPNSQVKSQLIPFTFDSAAATSIALISVTDVVANQFLRSAGRDLKVLQDQLDDGDPGVGFKLGDLQVEAEVDVEKENRTGRNVLAKLTAPESEGYRAIVVGAHVDHLGLGQTAGSLAREDEKNQIHFGADDNASGVAGVLEIAQYLADLKARGGLPAKRDLLIAVWSGEEVGLLGSRHFVRNRMDSSGQTLDSQIAAYLNMDMIGRLRKSLVIQGVGSSSFWPKELERSNVQVGVPITIQEDSYLPTDATSFYVQGVPLLSAFTGAHEDYHTPRDTADKVNYQGQEKIVKLMTSLVRSLLVQDEEPDYVEMDRPEGTGARVSLRAFLGTVPDYSQGDVTGVLLSGVMKGGPADDIGILEGDIIVRLAGKAVENIYDYTYAIEGLKVGVSVEMVVLRGDDRMTFAITPGARE